MTPDGRLLVSTDRGVKAIDAETLRVIRRYPVCCVAAVSPDGRTAAIEAADGGLRLLDLASGRVRTLLRQGHLGARAFSPDGRTLSTAEDGGNVILWDVEEGVPTETLEGHVGTNEQHAFSPDGRTLYTAGNDGRVIVWDVAGDRRLGRPFPRGLGGLESGLNPPAFALSPDGRALAVARLDGRVELIDAETLRRTASFEAFPGRAAVAIDYSADGRRLAVAGEGGGVGVWDVESGEQLGALLRAPRGPRASQPANRLGARLRPGRSARRGGGGGRGADLGPRPARAASTAAAPACIRARAGVQPGRLAAGDSVRCFHRRRSQRGRDTRRRQAASGLPGLPPTARSARLPSPPTAACSREARSTAARSSGRPTAGGGWDVRSLSGTRPLTKWSSHRTGTHLRPHTRTRRRRSGTSPRRSRSGPA